MPVERLIKWFLILVSLIVVGLAFSHPELRRFDGWPDPLSWTIALWGIALLVVAITLYTSWGKFGRLTGLAIFGQACALAILNTPNYGVLQHYPEWPKLLSTPNIVFLSGPTLQSIVAIQAFRKAGRQQWQLARKLFTGPQALLFAVMMAFSAANFSRNPFVYSGEVLLAGWIIITSGLTLLLAATSFPKASLEAIAQRISLVGDKTQESVDWVGQFDRYLPVLAAIWVLTITAVISSIVFERLPHIPDSVAFLTQARYFAAGKLSMPAPPVKDAFELLYLVNDGTKWYTYSFLGWPAVLSIGVLAGAPWLVNPILGAITVLLTYALLRRLYDLPTVRIATLLLAFSPWFLYMSASYMTHPVSLVFSLVALYAVESARRSRGVIWGVVAGISLGALFLVRPLEGMAISIVAGLWSLGLWGKRLRAPAMLSMIVVAAVIGSLHLVYNQALTGNALYFPMERYFDEAFYPGANGLGFGPNKGNVGWTHIDPLPGHGPVDVVINSNQNLYLLNSELFAWGFGSLFFVLALVVWRGLKPADQLMLAIIVMVIAGNSLYFYSGAPDFGARYWYQMLIPLVILTVRGAHKFRERVTELGVSSLDASRVWVFIAAATLVGFTSFVPRQAFAKYHNYRGMRADMFRLSESCRFDGALVFVQELDKSDYPSAFVFNAVDLNTDQTIYVRDLGEDSRAQVLRSFPNRSYWVVRGSEQLGGEFSVVEGPRSPAEGELLERPAGCQ